MKKVISCILTLALALGLAACGSTSAVSSAVSAPSSAASQEEETVVNDLFENTPVTAFHIAGLKGPTTMGLVNLIEQSRAGQTHQDYQFTMYGAADEIVPLLVKGELDMAAVPCNLAATLYQKTEGAVQIVAVNTLGVLYMVEDGDTVHTVADLAGKTILTTGKGTTPEYVLRYLLQQNELDPDADVTIEYYSEATEVVARMAEQEDAVAMLPQPFVTSAQSNDENLRVALDMSAEWSKVAGTDMVTGVMVARREFLEQNPEPMQEFLHDYEYSVVAANRDVTETAALCEKYEVVPKAALAEKALPQCNIVFIPGEEMKANVSAYLQVLFEADPASVGGALPGDDFYYYSEQ